MVHTTHPGPGVDMSPTPFIICELGEAFCPYLKIVLYLSRKQFSSPYTYVPLVLLKLNQNDVPQANARSFFPFQLFPFLAAVSEVHQRHTLDQYAKLLQKGPLLKSFESGLGFSSFSHSNCFRFLLRYQKYISVQ